MKVVFSERAYNALLAETYEKIKTETGGVFLGFYQNETWYIVETIDPGPNSIFEVAYFEYDTKYTNHLINKIARLYNTELVLLGLWHRHPGSLDVFSGTDDRTNTTFAKIHKQGTISMLVNIDPKFRLTVYHVTLPLTYTKISYEVGDHLFPEGVLELKSKEMLLSKINGHYNNMYSRNLSINCEPLLHLNNIMKKACQNLKPLKITQLSSEDFESMYESNQDMVEEYIDLLDTDLHYLSDELKIKLSLSCGAFIELTERGTNEDSVVYFTKMKEPSKYVFMYGNNFYEYSAGLIKNSYTKEKEHISPFKKLRNYIGEKRRND